MEVKPTKVYQLPQFAGELNGGAYFEENNSQISAMNDWISIQNPFPILVLDREGFIVEANETARMTFQMNIKNSVHFSAIATYPREIDLEEFISKNLIFEFLGQYQNNSFKYILKGVSKLDRLIVYIDDINELVQSERRLQDITSILRNELDGQTKELLNINSKLVNQLTFRKELEEEKNLLSAAVEAAGESVVITDVNNIIIYVNPAFERISGYIRQEVLGNTPRVLKSDKHPFNFYKEMWDVLLKGMIWKGRITNKKKDGTYYHEDATIAPIRDIKGHVVNYIAVKRDISREVELENQFLQAQKMDAMGKLAGGIAHDLNNILTVITGTADLSLMKLDSSNEFYKSFNEILNTTQRATSLLRKILAFSRKQVSAPRILDLNSIIEDTGRMLVRLIRKDIKFEKNFEDSLHSVKIDPGQIEQVIMNLVLNAQDAMPDGGKIKIKTSNIDLKDNMCDLEWQAGPGRYVLLEIKDHGTGMSEDVKSKLFEPFFTTKEEGKGTGLGLATVYGIIKQNHGIIKVDSEIGAGSTFSILLPAVDGDAEDFHLNLSEETSYPKGSEKVLVIDQEPGISDLIEEILSSLGYEVTNAHSLQNLECDSLQCSKYDLIITNIIQQKKNSSAFNSLINKHGDKTKILYISSYLQNERMQERIENFNLPHLPKPFGVLQLAQKVREILD